jgi:hypothetical protein
MISLVLPVPLPLKDTRGSQFADRAAWALAILSCLISAVGLMSAGLAMLPVAVLTVCAVATEPFGPNPMRDDHLRRSSVTPAARAGSW